MRARISDPIGPWWWRAMPTAISVSIMASAILLSMDAAPFKGSLFALGAMLFFIAPLFLPRLAPRSATLELGDGVVGVRDAGVATQTIRTRDVTAASTARTPSGVALALVRNARDGRPIVLDLDTDADAHRVRDALGIGHFGFGAIDWPTKRGSTMGVTILVRVMAAISCAMLAGSASDDGLLILGMLLGYFTIPSALIMMMVTFFRGARQTPTVSLRQEGLAVSQGSGRFELIPYSDIANAKGDALGLHLVLHGGGGVDIDAPDAGSARGRMSSDELAHLVAQILSAAQRAQGIGPQPAALPARVADLAQRAEGGRSWLARLDAIAQLLASGAGYRGCGFEENDLWMTLEDHDAPADLRAAAARVLVRVGKDGTKPRIASVLARVRDDDARSRIRVATDDDIENAGDEIDRIDEREARRQRVA